MDQPALKIRMADVVTQSFIQALENKATVDLATDDNLNWPAEAKEPAKKETQVVLYIYIYIYPNSI